jgi:hypothetical protein
MLKFNLLRLQSLTRIRIRKDQPWVSSLNPDPDSRLDEKAGSALKPMRIHHTAFIYLSFLCFLSSKVLGDFLSRSKNPYRSVLIMSTLSGDFR